MKKLFFLTVSIFVSVNVIMAQTTAMDFNRMDCNGTARHLFADLDSGKVVILEYFMGPNCSSCEDAAREIEGMKAKFLTQYPGKVMSYAMGYQNSYTCSTIMSWVSNLGVSAIPMDSGALQVAYYGGFAMPTIAVVAGSDHKVIYTANANNGGYTNGDTSKMSVELNKFFNPASVSNLPSSISYAGTFPNPAGSELNVELVVNTKVNVAIQLTDLTGRVILSTAIANVKQGRFSKTLMTSGLAPGLYMVNVYADGSMISKRVSIIN